MLEEKSVTAPAFSFKGRDLHEEEALLVLSCVYIHIHIR